MSGKARWVVLVAASALVFCGICAAETQTNVGGEVAYWMATLDGNVKANTSSVTGTQLDVISGLGMDDEEGIAPVKAWVEFDNTHRLSIAFWQVDYKGQLNLERNIVFNGVTYADGTTIDSKLDAEVIELLYENFFVRDEDGRVGLVLGLKNFQFDGEMSSSAAGTQRKSIDLPCPVAGLSTEFDAGKGFEVRGAATVGKIDVQDVDVMVVDLMGGLYYNITDNVSAGVSYRYLTVDGDNDKGSVDLQFDGPVATISAQF